jgi:hypothetical protein
VNDNNKEHQSISQKLMIINILFTNIKNFDFSFSTRLVSYFAIWLFYLNFMLNHSPRGVEWLSFSSRRIFNAVQYVKVNGYFQSYGFSIWSSCQDCSFSLSEWADKIYLSLSIFWLLPYIVLNHFLGLEGLLGYGAIVDKLIIFIAAVGAAELIIICVRIESSFHSYYLGIVGFLLFATSPWTYRMLLSPWPEVYFVPSFLLGLLFFYHGRVKIGTLMLLFAGLIHYQWALAVAGLYSLLFFGSEFFKNDLCVRQYLPAYGRTIGGFFVIVLALMVSSVIQGISRWLIELQNIQSSSNSLLLFRIGISGDDIHNGGLIGALQFLGGNRVTLCIADFGAGALMSNLTDGIQRYNCFLSIGGMILLSLSAIVGLVILLKRSLPAKWIVFPLMYSLMLFVTILQQSLSAHLMGYSYIFSFLFSIGMVGLIVHLGKYINSSTLKLILSLPCVLGIVFLSIRVSMLTGANG